MNLRREARRILELLKFTRCVIRRRVRTPTSAGAFQAVAATHKIYQRGTPEGERAFFFLGQAGHLSELPCERDTRVRTIYTTFYTGISSPMVVLTSDGIHFSFNRFRDPLKVF